MVLGVGLLEETTRALVIAALVETDALGEVPARRLDVVGAGGMREARDERDENKTLADPPAITASPHLGGIPRGKLPGARA